MKRTKIMGICVVAAFAAFAFSAMAASSASAATYNWCKPMKHGHFSDGSCTVPDEKKGKGKGSFELKPVEECESVGKKGFYSDSACTVRDEKKGKPKGTFEKYTLPTLSATTGNAVLKTPAFGTNNVECSASTSTGALTGPKTGFETATFTGCQLLGAPCESIGPNSHPSGSPGVIITAKLGTRLVGHGEKALGFEGKEPASGEVWTEIVTVGEHGVFSSEFSCPAAATELRTTQNPSVGSSLSGVTSDNVSSTTGTVTFGEAFGESALLTEVFNLKMFGGWGPPGGAPSSENTVGHVTWPTAIDVKS